MTFLQSLDSLGAFGDRVLAKALGAVDAGACVPSHGQVCGCAHISPGFCAPMPKTPNTVFKISCFGACTGNPNGPCCA